MRKKSKQMKYLNGVALTALGAAVIITTPGAMAQVVDEVVVTARKRAESLSEVPVAITAFNADQLTEAGITELGDVLNNSSGTVYNERDGNRSTGFPGIRGVKTFASVASTVQRISSFVNGMPMVGPQATINMVDVQGVEVYKGPQSAVFGRSVFAGAINYNTRKPNLQELEAGVSAEIGENGRQGVNGYVTMPIIEDQLSFMVSAAYDSYDGPGSPVSTDGFDIGTRETQYFSGSLLWEPTDNLSLQARYSNISLDDGPAADYNLDPATDPNYSGAVPVFRLYTEGRSVFRTMFCLSVISVSTKAWRRKTVSKTRAGSLSANVWSFMQIMT